MKRNTMKKAAVLAAAVMAFSAMGMIASANGWTETENGRKYVLSSGEEASSGKYIIGGVVYDFSKEGYCLGEYNGWAKSGGINRFYNQGTPYTGWLKTKDGAKKYVLDGYLVTGEFQIGNTSYSFNNNGILSGEAPLAISADVGKVSADTETITIKLTMLENGLQSFGVPVLLERWEKGEWVNCFADSEGGIPMTLQLYSMSEKDQTLEIQFNSLAYTDYKLTPGYYRIPINNVSDSGAIFKLPIAITGDGVSAQPISAQPVKSEATAAFASTYAMFEVVE